MSISTTTNLDVLNPLLFDEAQNNKQTVFRAALPFAVAGLALCGLSTCILISSTPGSVVAITSLRVALFGGSLFAGAAMGATLLKDKGVEVFKEKIWKVIAITGSIIAMSVLRGLPR